MGMARLLAKGWVVFCLFAGAHSLNMALVDGASARDAVPMIGVCTALFVAMGLLFIGGYAAATDHGGSLLARIRPWHFLPGFNETVFVIFVALSFANQAFFAPDHMNDVAVRALRSAIAFAVPGQRELKAAFQPCWLDGGRVFSSAFAWLLAIVYVASAVSRLKLSAGLIRLERATRPEALGAVPLALVLGVAAVIGIQLLFMGSAYQFIPCTEYAELPGTILVGLGPLMLAYLIVAACANLLATSPE